MTRTLLLAAFLALQQPKAYRLPATDLKEPVIWGSVCEVPGGPSLAFGGEDQRADDGNPHTRIKADGAWKAIDAELRAKNPDQKAHERCLKALELQKEIEAHARTRFFDGEPVDLSGEKLVLKMLEDLMMAFPEGPRSSRLGFARALTEDLLKGGIESLAEGAARSSIEEAAEAFDAEPPPRALSPIAYDEKTRLFVIFGGDHLDYLTNDTWVFDPQKRAWSKRWPHIRPAPRANHRLTAVDGKIVLSGGYTYTSSTDYVGGQYRDVGGGDWTYDLATDVWTGGEGTNVTRVYRTGRLSPEHYVKGPKPDRDAFGKVLAELPANTWVRTQPPQLPALNRDWGTAVLDLDHDLILRWSGGHSAHGGTDVLEYHLKTNRWELCYPVEFPLGQLYSNTEYPEGVNFNRRPWVTGHTYQNYGYDPPAKKMIFTGRHSDSHVYDPALGDWTGRFAKPPGMVYGSCFYTLTLAPTPQGLVCWTESGRIFQFEKGAWIERKLSGDRLPGAVVDHSTVFQDAKRNRLLFARKPYGDKVPFTGELYALDLGSWSVSTLAPAGKEAAAAIPYLCQIRYDAQNDLGLVGGTLPPGPDGVRRTPAYDPAGNRWVSLKIGGDDPSGKKGRNVSLGMMYDAKRKLFWAVDTNSNVFVLRLDVKSADLSPL